MNPPCTPPDEAILQAAEALRPAPGFVFLDSAIPADTSESLLAANPTQIVSGGPGEWDRFHDAFETRANLARASHSSGGAVGWVAYDGSFRFGFYDVLHRFDHGRGRWNIEPQGRFSHRENPVPAPEFSVSVDPQAFIQSILQAKEYIAAGDIYQVCLSHPLQCRFSGDAFPFYKALRRVSPAPFSAFLDLGETQVVSASPECFLDMRDRRIVTRPIKGTRRREGDARLDALAARELLSSSKEMAELVMITDLERNDLGRVCEFGSVVVDELLTLERYRQVYHLVSTVRGRLRPEITHLAALQACFPGGSISGAPKKRAMEIIHELESWNRGIYTGAIGFFAFDGTSRFSVAIRTAVFENGAGQFGVGAGIVADSDPAREWQETLDKAAGVLAACREFGR